MALRVSPFSPSNAAERGSVFGVKYGHVPLPRGHSCFMNGFMAYQRMVHYNPGESGTCYDGPLANGKVLEAALDPLKCILR